MDCTLETRQRRVSRKFWFFEIVLNTKRQISCSGGAPLRYANCDFAPRALTLEPGEQAGGSFQSLPHSR